MSYREQYDFWLKDAYFDGKTKDELQSQTMKRKSRTVFIRSWSLVRAAFAA